MTEVLEGHGILIVDLPHHDKETGKFIEGVDLYFEDGTELEDVADFMADKDDGVPTGKLWVLISPEGQASKWKLAPSYRVPWGKIKDGHNTYEDWN